MKPNQMRESNQSTQRTNKQAQESLCQQKPGDSVGQQGTPEWMIAGEVAELACPIAPPRRFGLHRALRIRIAAVAVLMLVTPIALAIGYFHYFAERSRGAEVKRIEAERVADEKQIEADRAVAEKRIEAEGSRVTSDNRIETERMETAQTRWTTAQHQLNAGDLTAASRTLREIIVSGPTENRTDARTLLSAMDLATNDRTVRQFATAMSDADKQALREQRVLPNRLPVPHERLRNQIADRLLAVLPRETKFGVVDVLKGPQGPTYAVSLSVNGKRAVSGGHDRVLRIWDLESSRCDVECRGHRCCIVQANYSPDQKYIVTGSCDEENYGLDEIKGIQKTGTLGLLLPSKSNPDLLLDDETLRLWDAQTGRPIHDFSGFQSPISHVEFTPDSKTLLVVAKRRAMLFDVAEGKMRREFGEKVHFAACSPLDGTILTSNGREIDIWSPDGLQKLGVPPGTQPGEYGSNAFLTSLGFSVDGKHCYFSASFGVYGTPIHVWDYLARREVRRVVSPNVPHVAGVSLAPDSGRIIVAGLFHHVQRPLDFSPQSLAAGLDAITNPGQLKEDPQSNMVVWQAGQDEQRFINVVDQGWCLGLSTTRDGQRGLTGHRNGNLVVWNLPTDQTAAKAASEVAELPFKKLTAHTDPPRQIDISENGQYLVSASGSRRLRGERDHSLRLWDVPSQKTLTTIQSTIKGQEFTSVAVAHDGAYFSGTQADSLCIFDRIGKCISQKTLRAPHRVTFSPGSHNVAVSRNAASGVTLSIGQGAGGTGSTLFGQFEVLTFRAKDGMQIGRFAGIKNDVTAIALNGSGSGMITGDTYGRLAYFDQRYLAKGESVQSHEHTDHDVVHHVAFSDDGLRIVSCGASGGLYVWDVTSGNNHQRFSGCRGPVLGAAFTQEGKQLVSAEKSSSGGLVFRWWSTSDRKQLRLASMPGNVTTVVRFARNGKLAAYGLEDSSVCLVDL